MSPTEISTFELPEGAFAGVGSRGFGLYLHVPFCATRCGYCDFNTYTPGDLGVDPAAQRVPMSSWLEAVRGELSVAARQLETEGSVSPPVDTVFVGGGTPSLLGGDGLVAVLDAVREYFPLADDVEVTTEANPESTSPELFDRIRRAGFTRVSLGMQSAVAHVLEVLDRTHTPGRALRAVEQARAAGFEHINLDVIYGTPGERDEDLQVTLDTVLAAGIDHVSAYSLIVEDGTALARRVRRGELPPPDDDVLAARYEIIDARLSAAGLRWYEVSNWAVDDAARCRHNLGYWTGGDWLGIGPGAHSHVGGVRWWNVKHPARYAATVGGRALPVAGFEMLTAPERYTEAVMLGVRLADGLDRRVLASSGRIVADRLIDDGLLFGRNDHLILTDRGRLLADAVVRELLC